MMSESETTDGVVLLRVEGQLLPAPKELLCQHSAFFRAMFSGNYRDHKQDIIDLEIVDVESMKQILTFMEKDKVELDKLPIVSNLVTASSYLQVDRLIDFIEVELIKIVDLDTWADLLELAKATMMNELALKAVACGLHCFRRKDLLLNSIKTLSTLQWYMSHSHLEIDNELDVFMFGKLWIELHKMESEDAILLILGCLSIGDLLPEELLRISESDVIIKHSKARSIVYCLRRIMENHCKITSSALASKSLVEEFGDEVLEEVRSLVDGSSIRWKGRACVPAYSNACNRSVPVENEQYLYQWDGARLARCLAVVRGPLWGWSWAPWGPRRVVVVGGERGPGAGRYECDVRVWSAVKNAWSEHGVSLPQRRHAGVLVHRDTLYIVGGVGGYRVIVCSVIAYDLLSRTVKDLPQLPEAVQSPAVAVHRGELVVGGARGVYVLRGRWLALCRPHDQPSCLLSVGERLLYTCNYQRDLSVIDVANGAVRTVATFEKSVMAICSTGEGFTAFTDIPDQDELEHLACVEVCPAEGGAPRRAWCDDSGALRYRSAAGCFALALEPPPVDSARPAIYARELLRRLEACS